VRFTSLVPIQPSAADALIGERGQGLVFIVGSPRSGTSWLARLMGAHEAIAATQETELLNRYCQTWFHAWNEQLPTDADQWSRHRHRGLPAVLTAEELDNYVLGFARDVYAKVLSLKPTARVVVDKNPEYSLHIDVIRRMFPDAGVIHIVRDGRDVAASMLAASRGWGRDWAPAQVRLAAQTWRACVESASAARSGRYLQIGYEDLLAAGPRVLADCLRFAGVAATPEECAEIIGRFDHRSGTPAEDSLVWSGEVIKRRGGPPTEPAGFYGSAAARGWRQTWAPRDRIDFNHVAGDLLRDLGYATDDDWLAATRATRMTATAARRITDAGSRLGWRLHMMLGRRGLYVQVGRVDPYPRDAHVQP
jgi:Sulfotransferase family